MPLATASDALAVTLEAAAPPSRFPSLFCNSASADHTALSFRVHSGSNQPIKPSTHLGHKGRVLSVRWSHASVSGAFKPTNAQPDAMYQRKIGRSSGSSTPRGANSYTSPLLLTSSVDNTARMWLAGKSDALLVFSTVRKGKMTIATAPMGSRYSAAKPKAGANAAKPNPEFKSEIIGAQFFYNDRFVVLASGPTLYLYNYNLEKALVRREGLPAILSCIERCGLAPPLPFPSCTNPSAPSNSKTLMQCRRAAALPIIRYTASSCRWNP